jgi:B12-binding domain/radical SAM domain protein
MFSDDEFSKKEGGSPMKRYDVVLIHPPAVYDFRRKPMFPGALGPSVEAVQFSKVPIGMLSLAEYLDRHGYKVVLDNIGDRMVNIPQFDVEQHLESYSAPIFAIGMHFQQHAQGALEMARLCKAGHPGSLVIMGGLTATCFHEEIISKFDFVDGVIRAEAEKPMLHLVRAVEKTGRIADTPNLTYRTDDGDIRAMPLMKASMELDEFEFTRFDLLEPKTSIYSKEACERYSLEVCRGCVYNCAICGGSAYTYQKYLGMQRPAFRSPAKIVADMKRLNDQGIFFIGLFQDPRMAGKRYWQELIAAMVKEKPVFERLSLDLLIPADEEFIREVARIGRRVIFHLCPDTGSDRVRRLLGRHYSNESLLNTISLCHKYRIPVTNFFSVGLAGETEHDVKKTWRMWERLNELDRQAMAQGLFDDIADTVPIGGPILGPIVLDPGSQAFDTPDKYGYKLLYDSLEAYIDGLSQPSWHQWLNYETHLLNKAAIVDLIQQSVEFTIDQKEKYGYYSDSEAGFHRVLLEMDRAIVQEMDRIMKLDNPRERHFRIVSIRKNLDDFLRTRQLDVSD